MSPDHLLPRRCVLCFHEPMASPFQLVYNWDDVLKHAWSSRLLVVAVFLSGVEAILWFFDARLPMGDLGRALLHFGVTAGALASRIVVQEKVKGNEL